MPTTASGGQGGFDASGMSEQRAVFVASADELDAEGQASRATAGMGLDLFLGRDVQHPSDPLGDVGEHRGHAPLAPVGLEGDEVGPQPAPGGGAHHEVAGRQLHLLLVEEVGRPFGVAAELDEQLEG